MSTYDLQLLKITCFVEFQRKLSSQNSVALYMYSVFLAYDKINYSNAWEFIWVFYMNCPDQVTCSAYTLFMKNEDFVVTTREKPFNVGTIVASTYKHCWFLRKVSDFLNHPNPQYLLNLFSSMRLVDLGSWGSSRCPTPAEATCRAGGNFLHYPSVMTEEFKFI